MDCSSCQKKLQRTETAKATVFGRVSCPYCKVTQRLRRTDIMIVVLLVFGLGMLVGLLASSENAEFSLAKYLGYAMGFVIAEIYINFFGRLAVDGEST